MNAKALRPTKFNFFDKQFLVSRIACILFATLLLSYIVGGVGIVATLVSLSFILLFIAQFLFQFQLLNAMLGGIMFLVGVYFSMAVWSEFSEFEVINKVATQLIVVGWSGCLAVITLGGLMVRSALLND